MARGAYQTDDADAGPSILASGLAVAATEIVNPDWEAVCAIQLKRSGKGRKVAYSQAVFRIRLAATNAIVAPPSNDGVCFH